MNVTQKEYAKLKKKNDKTKTVTVKEKTSVTKEPDWFNKDVDITETTVEEVEELDMILKGLV